MNILIVNANKNFFTDFDSKLKFTSSTVNTSMFKISEAKFQKLRNHIRSKGLNPYGLMSW